MNHIGLGGTHTERSRLASHDFLWSCLWAILIFCAVDAGFTLYAWRMHPTSFVELNQMWARALEVHWTAFVAGKFGLTGMSICLFWRARDVWWCVWAAAFGAIVMLFLSIYHIINLTFGG